ncbi:MAG TPA: hypothetical protein VKY33_06430 [Flavobacterium sp.]|nr:hypothetical protein [Flavobacterium sp.]
MYYIRKYLEINNGCVWVNGQRQMQAEATDFGGIMKEFYKQLGINYPKFYKMDDLCKLAFIGSEIMLDDSGEKNVALLFSNSESSLETDRKHQQSIASKEAYFPSPAVFVYTLPNIAIGEVSIRHQLKNESVFFVSDTFPVETMVPYAEYLLQSGRAEEVLCAWIYKWDNEYKAFFYLVGKQGTKEHSINELVLTFLIEAKNSYFCSV